MKKFSFLPTIILFSIVLLSSCRGVEDLSLKISENIPSIDRAEYLADITAIFPDREAQFKLDYNYLKDGDDTAEIVFPEEIAGTKIHITGKNADLEFDGVRLEMGKLGKDGFSPISAIPSLLSSWSDGNFKEVQNTEIFGKEAILVISEIADDNFSTEYRSWFSKDEYLPLYAEIFSDGSRIIQCKFERAEHTKG